MTLSKMVFAAVAGSAAALRAPADSCTSISSEKVDCAYSGITQSGCFDLGCCWAEVQGDPWCFYTQDNTPGTCFTTTKTAEEPFQVEEVGTMRALFLANVNIQGSGGVVAAPDTNTPGGSYYYHWERDGALTMRALQETSPSTVDVTSYMKSYTQWLIREQGMSDPNGIDTRIEPKFNLPDGTPYTGGWCRPQNDAPGLRAITLMIFAATADPSYVSQFLWTGSSANYRGGLIKYDLDWLVVGYKTNTCDLWEEVQSTDFFWNRVTMKKALLEGAAFADAHGDSASAASYRSAAGAVNATLFSAHWDANGQFIYEAANRKQDGAVIVGLNDGYTGLDGMFAPTSYEVASTVKSFNLAFCNEYTVNPADTAKGIPGVLYGRYPGDSYAGGNPWVLTTAALGNLFYRAAVTVATEGLPAPDAMAAWGDALGEAFPEDAAAAADLFLRAGDSVLLRLRAHVEADGFHLDEQIDRNTGAQTSAADLTWSYAEVLNAMTTRSAFLAL
jgi:glucoamylase